MGHSVLRPIDESPAEIKSSRNALRWHFISRPWFKKVLFVAGDIMAVTVSHRISEIIICQFLSVPRSALDPSGYYLFYVPFFAFIVYLFGSYKSPGLRRPEKDLEILVKSVAFFFIALICANFVLFKTEGFSRYLVVGWFRVQILW